MAKAIGDSVLIALGKDPKLFENNFEVLGLKRNQHQRTLHDEAGLKKRPRLDGLYADRTIIKLLKELNFSFIITAKESDLDYLFNVYQVDNKQELVKRKQGQEIFYRYMNELPLNDVNSEMKVNLLECAEIQQSKRRHFCWITDMKLIEEIVEVIAKGGRARGKIENETFLIDQVQESSCKFFRAALEKCKSQSRLWGKIRVLFFSYFVGNWAHIYRVISEGLGVRLSVVLNSS